MLDLKPSLHHVTLQTWNTKDEVSTGIDSVFDTWFFGGNIGHASIVMTLPINDETKRWVEKYCYEQTFEKYKASLDVKKQKKLTYDDYLTRSKCIIPTQLVEDVNYLAFSEPTGDLKKTARLANDSEYFRIEFSYWPVENGCYILTNTEEDSVDNRIGRHFEYTDKAKSYLQPEERKHKGLFGSSIKTYSPLNLTHRRNLTDKQFRKINILQVIENLESQIKLKDILIAYVDKMKSGKVGDSLKLLWKNIGLELIDLKNTLEKKDLVAIKQDLKNIITKHVDLLKENKCDFEALYKILREYIHTEKYVTKGLAPDNSVVLPYCTNNKKGLNPEAMLEQMHRLVVGGNFQFNDILFNCSTSTNIVLNAGSKHDSGLNAVLTKKMFRYFDSPQQMLNNAQRAQEIIESNKKASLFELSRTFNYIDKSIVKLLHRLNDPNNTNLDSALIGLMLLFLGIIQIPGMILGVLLSPSNAMGGIIDLIQALYEKSSAILVPLLITILAFPLLVVLTPFVMVEQVIRLLTLPFEWGKAPSKAIVESDASITSPLPTTGNKNRPTGTPEENARKAKAMDKKIAGTIQANTMTLPDNKEIEQLLESFEKALETNKDRVVALSPQGLDSINAYLSRTNDTQISQRFFKCCKESLTRANNLKPKTPKEFDDFTTLNTEDPSISL